MRAQARYPSPELPALRVEPRALRAEPYVPSPWSELYVPRTPSPEPYVRSPEHGGAPRVYSSTVQAPSSES
jgi:hypothetical protein